MTILEAARLLRKREISASELVDNSLRRIAALNPELNAFITVMDESARAAACRADQELARGQDRGPLHGIPVALKDLFCTRGVRTTSGSKLFANYVPDHDAAVVEQLTRAGAVIVGKTNMHELAYGVTSANPHFGEVRNPRALDRIPGGSSGGSAAAVASGMVFAAMGSDTGGSIRIPSSFCGVTGLKPTYGRVSRYGALPLDFSLDHMGPIAASVSDTAVVLNAIAGYDPRDDSSSRRPVTNYVPAEDVPLAGLRIGLPRNFYFNRIAPEVREAVERAAKLAEENGARVAPVRLPDMETVNAVGRLIQLADAAAIFTPYLNQRDSFGADVLALLDQGRLIPATEYVNAQRLRRLLQQEFRGVWKDADVLLAPTTPCAAPKSGETTVELGGEREDIRLAATRLVRGMNVLGLPSISISCAADSRGLPLGLQVMASEFQEPVLLRAAAGLEMLLGLNPA